MVRAQQALAEILLVGLDEEPQEVLMLKARTLIEKFKAASAADHHAASTVDQRSFIASELTKLRDAVDHEIDRRVDEDQVDTVCDLLEHLSSYLHEETGGSQDATAPMNDDSGGENASNVAER